jgi:hypothetical protein
MGGLTVELPEWEGRSMSLVQAAELARLLRTTEGRCHWHFNDCGCCVTLHGPDHAYVITREGEAIFFASRGCSCEP